MIRVLIVDDDSLVRVTLRSMISWESYGYTVVQDCSSATQALHYLKSNAVDLMITDIKMPGITGLECMQQLRKQGRLPVTVVLSGYDEFELVREAFRLGAYDYLLKGNISTVGLEQMLTGLQQKIFRNAKATSPVTTQNSQTLEAGEYAVAVFHLHDFPAVARRFGEDLQGQLIKPILELTKQIHRLHGRAVFLARDPSCYELYYPVTHRDRIRDIMISITLQIQGVWRDFMNLEAAVGISAPVPREEIPQNRINCDTLCKLSVLQGIGKICTQWQWGELAEAYERKAALCDDLIAALCSSDDLAAQTQLSKWLATERPTGQFAQNVLILLARLGESMCSYGQNYFSLFPGESSAVGLVQQFDTSAELELWLRNLLRQIQSSCEEARNQPGLNIMERARRFMQDNFNNPELSLKNVAEYVGFNEKYFSTRFTKESGCTFIAYLNDLRIHRAQELLRNTDLKMYEISEAVGYGSVEHFNHIFKKKLCISPSEYRKSQKKC